MASVIHGSAWKALSAFREHPAAAVVYLLYCARANMEGVAWPSEKDMQAATGWSAPSCREARKWLIDTGALEVVSGYIRPEWRKLEPDARAYLMKADGHMYCRLTGVITIDGAQYPLLYDGHREGARLPDEGARGNAASMIDNPGDFSVKEINQATLTPDEWQKLLAAERMGRKRRSVINLAVLRADGTASLSGLFDAIVSAFGWNIESLNDLEAGRVRKAAKLLSQSGVKPEEVSDLVKYCSRFDNAGPLALAGHVQAWRAQSATRHNKTSNDDDPQQRFFESLGG